MILPRPDHMARRLLRASRLMFVPMLCASLVMAFPSRAAEPETQGLSALLTRYLHVIGGKGQAFDTRFDYEQLFIDEGLYREPRSGQLDAVRGQLLAVQPSTLSPSERLAWALNTYNFLVIDQMTRNLLVPGRKFQRYDSPLDVHSMQGSFFGAPVVRLDGIDYSITGFARRFVYGDSGSRPRLEFYEERSRPADPRLMFALVHGTLGSAPLLPWVYRADSLERQLDRAARIALALPTWLRIDASSGLFSVSNHVFDERADYGGPELPGLLPFVERFGPPAAKKLMARRGLKMHDMTFEPSRKLNQFDHPAPKLPGLSRADSSRTLRKP